MDEEKIEETPVEEVVSAVEEEKAENIDTTEEVVEAGAEEPVVPVEEEN